MRLKQSFSRRDVVFAWNDICAKLLQGNTFRHSLPGGLGGKKAKRCQPPNLGELGDLLAAETATGW